MKRGADHLDEEGKIMEPMFPRLHVNDADKGGPKAPPRNKMALYEQLSVPSQRFNPGIFPLNPSNPSRLVPPASSSQGSGCERSTYFPLHGPPSTSTHSSRKFRASGVSGATIRTFSTQVRRRKKAGEDDFMVPVFVPSRPGHGKVGTGTDKEKFLPFSASSSDRRLQIVNSFSQSGMASVSSRRNELSAKPSGNEDYGVGEDLLSPEDGPPSRKRSNCFPIELQSCESPTRNNHDKCELSSDEVSEGSMVYSVPGFDISPDDVVGTIGQTHFWKARRKLVHQQRVFAVQVFELHRLIKVQQLIAKSSNLLLGDALGGSKPSLKKSSIKRLAVEIVEPPSKSFNHQLEEDSEKPSNKSEGSAENAAAKNTSISSAKDLIHPSSLSGGPASLGYYNQPPVHHPHAQPNPQWLVPVMSPSEGLVYKPYPGPVYTGNLCGGGYGPFNNSYSPPVPLMGNYMNPVYGVAAGMLMPSTDMSFSSIKQTKPPVRSRLAPRVREPAHKETELQGSTASSPSVTPSGIVGETEPKNPLAPFPVVPVAEGGRSEPCDGNISRPARVIKVIPHNGRSATESAARIFQFIQQERKQHGN